MKRLFVFAIIPCLLFGLEKVNLIKDAGFEKNSDLWLMRSEPKTGPGGPDSNIINRHDSDSAFAGIYCGTIDTRKKPGSDLADWYNTLGCIYQIITSRKQLQDIDTLELAHMLLFKTTGNKASALDYYIEFKLSKPSEPTSISVLYAWLAKDLTPGGDNPTWKIFPDTIGDEGKWVILKRDIFIDLSVIKGLSPELELDTFLFYGDDVYSNGTWRGQKVFFDNIRLTGYADYDVGVKAILSKDSVWKNTGYTPTARIKNFARKAADSFLVIATIEGGSGVVYADTLSWSLTADTEDTLSFKEFIPPDASNYTLTVSTIMTPDESDEDDVMSKPLYGSGIEEPVTPLLPSLILDVARNTPSSILVSYSIPNSEQGMISLYDPAGRRIENIRVKGSGEVSFKPGLATGVYFIRLETGHSSIVRKVVVLD